jgi:hypothetical protein
MAQIVSVGGNDDLTIKEDRFKVSLDGWIVDIVTLMRSEFGAPIHYKWENARHYESFYRKLPFDCEPQAVYYFLKYL